MPQLTDFDDLTVAESDSKPEIQDVLSLIISGGKRLSDIFFSPGRPPQVESGDQLVSVPGLPPMSAEDTARIASRLIGDNAHAKEMLRSQGACEVSYSVHSVSRFRASIFSQRGSQAIVMRTVPHSVPTLKSLKLPPQLGEIVGLPNGIVLVTGPAASGRSSTLAALINQINEERAYHIVTVEDPIEFIHPHKKSTVHQRELYSDAPSFSNAMRAAMRQSPKVILVGELRDRETIEAALEVAEAGHLVFSALHAGGISKAMERLLHVFPSRAQPLIRNRFSRVFRYIVCQRLLPSKDGNTRLPLVAILKSTPRTREYIDKGENENNNLLNAMRDGRLDGMQDFDTEIERLIRCEEIALETGLAHAINLGNLKLRLSDLRSQPAFADA
jgi:twitching motility protein PilT